MMSVEAECINFQWCFFLLLHTQGLQDARITSTRRCFQGERNYWKLVLVDSFRLNLHI